MTKQEYAALVRARQPSSPLWRDVFRAFFSGGLICCAGQGVQNGYLALGLSQEDAGLAVTVTLVFLGSLFTGLGLYDRAAKFAGAGTLVPVTGFSNSVTAPAMEFKAEGLLPGTAVKMFTIAGPVIVFGTAASIVCALAFWIAGLL